MLKQCVVCNKPFETNRPNRVKCSRDCAKLSHRKQSRESEQRRHGYDGHGTPVKCRTCGKIFAKSKEFRKYCRADCRNKGKKAYLKQYRLKQKKGETIE